MIALKSIAFILIFQYTQCWHDYDYWPILFDDYNYPYDPDFWPVESTTAKLPEVCPEDESSWTRNDIVDMIHYVESKLNITDTIHADYYNRAEELFDKYVKKLEDFITDFVDRPNHVKHILEIIADSRQSLEPSVEDIYVKLQEFSSYEEQFNVVSDRANKTFDILDKYKDICQLNCEISRVQKRRKVKGIKMDLSLRNSDTKTRYCFKLNHLYWDIYDRLSQFKEKHEAMLHHTLEHGDEMYNERFENLKSRLKDIAIVKFGKTMYDLLTLQDDYYHFGQYVRSNNVTVELENIKKNNLDIEQKIIDLEMEVEKYRIFCAGCDRKRQTRQSIPITSRHKYSRWSPDFDILDKLIYSESIIRQEDLKLDYKHFFEVLEAKLEDRDVINSYIEVLTPIQQEITYAIENEERELITLKNQIPPTSIADITELLQKTQELLHKILAAKEYIGHFI